MGGLHSQMQRSKLILVVIVLIVLFLVYTFYSSNRFFNKRDAVVENRIALWERRVLDANNPKDKAQAYCQVALGYSDLNEREKAFKYFDLALGIEPNNADILYQLAMVHLHCSEYDEALDTMAKAKEAARANGDPKVIKRADEGYEIVKKQTEFLRAKYGDKPVKWRRFRKVGDKIIYTN